MEKEILRGVARLDSTVRFARVRSSSPNYSDTGEFRLITDVSPKTVEDKTFLEVTLQSTDKKSFVKLPTKELEFSSAVYFLQKPKYGLQENELVIRITSSESSFVDLYYSLGGKLLLKHDFTRTKVRGKGTTTRYYKSWRNVFKFFKT